MYTIVVLPLTVYIQLWIQKPKLLFLIKKCLAANPGVLCHADCACPCDMSTMNAICAAVPPDKAPVCTTTQPPRRDSCRAAGRRRACRLRDANCTIDKGYLGEAGPHLYLATAWDVGLAGLRGMGITFMRGIWHRIVVLFYSCKRATPPLHSCRLLVRSSLSRFRGKYNIPGSVS